MKKIKTYWLVAMKFLVFAFLTKGQTPITTGKEIQLQTDHSNTQSWDYRATDEVRLKPGFHYGAVAGKSFHAGIDKNIVLPADYFSPFTQTDFDNRTINTSLPVGRINGVTDVSPSGATTYAIPIQVPPGTAGLIPNLSVVYNSQGGNGLLGVGWDIAGLSAITRVNNTIYHDTKVEAINLSSDDRFALDGNRLVTTGTYGSPGITYNTEIETFSRVTSNGTAGNGPDWFLVETKEGIKMEYGRTDEFNSNAKLLGTGNSSVLVWYINKIYDNFENYVSFHYIKDDKGHRISEIKYTGTASQEPYNKIRFIYDERNDKNDIYFGGEKIKRNILLREIDVLCEGKTIKRYNFKYSQSIFSYLKEIEEEASDNSALNTTQFIYGPGVSAQKVTASGIPISCFSFDPCEGYDHISGDFNGDGKDDIIDFPFTTSGSFKIWHPGRLHLNLGGNNFSSGINISGLPSSFFPNVPYSVSPGSILGSHKGDVKTVDLNGDGLSDLLIGVAAQDGGGNDIIIYSAYFANGSGFTLHTETITRPFGWTAIMGDYDGNGTIDLASYNPISSIGVGKIYFFDRPVGAREENLCGFPHASPNTNFKNYAIDFNGDGKSEILNVFEGSYPTITEFHNLSNTCGGFGTSVNMTASQIYSGSYPSYASEVFPGDFNGDGKTDLIVFDDGVSDKLVYDGPPAWRIGYSTGKSFSVSNFPHNLSPFDDGSLSTYPPKWLVMDIDGNGLADFIQADPSYMHLYYSTGTGFSHVFVSTLISGYDALGYIYDGLMIGDFRGDGAQDLGLKSENYFDIIHFNKANNGNLLHKIKDGFNFETTFEYSPLSTGGSFYTKGGTGTDFPAAINYQGPLYAVSSVTVPDGIGGTRQASYNYESAKVHKQGKGFLSFSKITSTDNTAGIKTEIDYAQIPGISPIVAHSVSGTITRATSDNSIISQSTITNSAKTAYGNKRFFPFVDYSVVVNNLRGQTITNDFTYDNDGNLTNSTVNYGAETESSTYTYVQKGSHIPNRVATQNILKTRSGDSYPISNSYDYYSTGKLMEQKVFNGQTKEVKTEYLYNSIGNLISATISSPGLVSRTTTINKYDENGRFAIKSTNPLGQVSEVEYDSKWGAPLMQKGVDGLISTYEYDAFGRMTKMKTPDNIETNYSINWVTSAIYDPLGNQIHALYSSSVQRNGSPNSTLFYDIYGRELKRQSERLASNVNNTPVFKNVNLIQTYNNKGQLLQKFAPYFDGDSPEYNTEYTYFTSGVETGMLKEADNTLTGVTIYDYDKTSNLFINSVTNPANQTSTQKTDASGKVVEATDNGGTLNYSYWAHGQLKEVLRGTDQLAYAEYDTYARQKKLIDPNANVIDYDYNAYGELEHQKDNMGNVYKMLYDQLGRITSKQCTTCIGIDANPTSWQYVASGSATNQTQLVTGPNGITQQYSYDNLGRMTSLTETIDGTPLITQYAYDGFSNISQITYPSGFKLAKTYNGKGFLTEVKNGTTNASIWNTPELNALGQYTAYNNGSIPVTKGFHPFGMLESYQAGSGGGVHDMYFNWDDATGNLSLRGDNTHLAEETFGYTDNGDNLNRLTSSTVTINGIVQSPTEVSYYPNGNIQNKTRIGGYSYNNTGQLNAVETVGNNYGDISSLTQVITYSPFNKTATVTEGDNILNLTYGPDNQRRISEVKNNGTTTRKIIYSGNYEKITALDDQGINRTYEVHYLSFGPGLVAMNIRHKNIDQLYYVYSDHLGSIVRLTEENGNSYYDQSFDAWGRERNAVDWSYTDNGTKPVWLTRGFTGHEHLPEFALINMNGRVYDPLLGRFNSPDNFVQNPYGTQGYNRYSYAFNNPLVYTDPNGENPALIVAAVIGGVVGGFAGWQIGEAQGATGWAMAGYIAGGVGIGALAGLTGGAIGGAVAGGGFAGATMAGAVAGGASAGAISGAGFYSLSTAGTGNFSGSGLWTSTWHGSVAGAAGGFVGGGVGGSAGAFLGGATSGAVGTALGGGTQDEIIQNALIGGFIGLGAYEIGMYSNYKMSNYEGSYADYHKISAATARANFWETEAGWYETTNGIKGVRMGRPFGGTVDLGPAPEGTIYEAHTHPKFGPGTDWFSSTDVKGYRGSYKAGNTYGYKVYGQNQVYTLTANKVATLPNPPGPGSNYVSWSIQYGLNLGTPHSINMYNHNTFWFGLH